MVKWWQPHVVYFSEDAGETSPPEPYETPYSVATTQVLEILDEVIAALVVDQVCRASPRRSYLRDLLRTSSQRNPWQVVKRQTVVAH